MKINKLENDLTIYILTDLNMISGEKTNVDGQTERKIIAKIDLKNVSDLKEKKKNNYVMTFNTSAGSTSEGYLESYPITVTTLNDLQRYNFFFTNSKFEAISIHQLKDEAKSTTTKAVWTVAGVSILVNFSYITPVKN